MKRLFDIVVVLPALMVLAPVLVLIALAVRLTSAGPVMFKQRRVGRHMRPFWIYKFRTMVPEAEGLGPGVTREGDARVTPLGRFLRASKLDELPQLFNVLKGDMSLVGPRPELPKYVDLFQDEYREILKVRPGITDPASIAYRSEGELLEAGADPEKIYLNVILPHKLRLSRTYVQRISMRGDIAIILKTVARVMWRRDGNRGRSSRGLRWVATVAIDAALIAAAYYTALYLRFDGAIPEGFVSAYRATVLLLVAIRIALLLAAGVPQGRWRYAGLKSLQSQILAVTAGSVAFWFLLHDVLGGAPLSNEVLALEWLVCNAFLGGARLGWRAWNELMGDTGLSRRVLLIGPEQTAAGVLHEMTAGRLPGYQAAGLLALDRRMGGGRIHGVRVYGTDRGLASASAGARPDELWMVGRVVNEEARAAVIHQSLAMGLPLKALPNLQDLVESKQLTRRMRRIEPEDLLFREPIPIDLASLKASYEGKRILVTGAGGSIGSELCRQLADCAPEALVLFEKHEASLYAIDHELHESHPQVWVEPFIGDVTDPQRVAEVMERARPSIVVHAAAYKHVPMMERNPSEAFKTNAYGTKVVAQAASRAGAEIFLLISTDKAVEPTSVMGLSKRLAEIAIQRMPKGSTKSMAVRFGNVLGTSGSVVPLFMDQIARGGPVTVTDPEITRHFMTVREAVHLVLQAGTMGNGGEVFVLDMGKPVRIVDLARALIRLYGYVPDQDVAIVYTGLRPGERQVEKLFNSYEEILKTAHPKILMAVGGDRDRRQSEDVMKLVEAVNEKILPAEAAELQTTLAEVLG